MYKFYLFITFLCVCGFSRTVDTVLTADGSPGPYSLGDFFIDSSSIVVQFFGPDTIGNVPLIYLDNLNALLFSMPIDSGTGLHVRYRTGFYGLPKMQRLYKLKRIDQVDSSRAFSGYSLDQSGSGLFAGEDLFVSGYKSIGVSVGGGGQISLEQSLDVRIYGHVMPQTELSANLSDQGTPLTGATRELSDIDLMYLSLTSPHYTAVLGDQYIRWPAGGIFSYEKKIKGVYGQYRYGGASVSAFGAISGGKSSVQTINGVVGRQGPYYLTGSGESDFINPIQGTVAVVINGDKLAEGATRDYTVDYDQGTITFGPKRLITSYDIIRVEYEYKTFDYLRSTYGVAAGYQSSDSSLSVHGTLWNISDNKERPIDLMLSVDDKNRLVEAGDQPVFTSSARPVAPAIVPQEDALYPLYSRDSLGHYVYAPYDPANPQNVTGLYYVWFVPATMHNPGDYISATVIDKSGRPRTIYRFAGNGTGAFTPNSSLPTPQQTIIGEVQSALVYKNLVRATVDIAASDFDKNLFSKNDDGDNQGVATRTSALIGRKDFLKQSGWISASHSLITQNFNHSVASVYQNKQLWNDTTQTVATEQQRWNAGAGMTIVPNVAVECGYGQLRHADTLLTQKVEPAAHVQLFDHLDLDYNGSFFRNHPTSANASSRREFILSRLTTAPVEYSLGCSEEWYQSFTTSGRGNIGGNAGAVILKNLLSENVSYTLYRRGNDNVLSSADTGNAFTWNQMLLRTLRPGWTIGGTSLYRSEQIDSARAQTTLLVTANHAVTSEKIGFSTQQTYSTSREQALRSIQRPVYRGSGLGTHIFVKTSDSTGEYVPSPTGDYIMVTQDVYDNISLQPIRKTRLQTEWSFTPPAGLIGGILADCEWHGSADIEEQVRDDTTVTARSWVPGYLSLAGKQYDGLLRYYQLSYRQDVTVTPDSMPEFTVTLFFMPSLNKILDFRERQYDYGGMLAKKVSPWVFDANYRSIDVRRTGSAMFNQFAILDRNLLLTQKYGLREDVDLFVKETGGWASKKIEGSVNSGWYCRVQPGVAWHPREKGYGEVSYTFSNVDLGPDIDYRMAQGFSSGISHVAQAMLTWLLTENFNIEASYRGQITKARGQDSYDRALHILSVQAKVFLH